MACSSLTWQFWAYSFENTQNTIFVVQICASAGPQMSAGACGPWAVVCRVLNPEESMAFLLWVFPTQQ